MDVIYVLIPLMIGLGLIGVVVFIWSVRSGQYDDMEGDANRILMDDDDPLLPDSPNKENESDVKPRLAKAILSLSVFILESIIS